MYKVAILAGAALLALSSGANAQTANADATNDTNVETVSGSAAINDGNTQAIVFEGSDVPDGSRAVPDVVVPSVIGNGACAGAGFSAGLGVSGFGLGLGANSIDEDCTIREYVTLMYNMCAAGNQTWCQVADRMLLNEVPMITQAWNDVVSPPPAPAPVAALPTAADAVPVETARAPAVVVPQVTLVSVDCPATAPRDSGELTRLFNAGCRWN